MLGPIVEGDRVSLVPLNAEHLDTLAKWRADQRVTRFMPALQFPPSRKQQDEWFEKIAASQEDIMWSIIERATGALLGITGMYHLSLLHRRGTGLTLLGDPGSWGRGLATEALRLRIAFLFSRLGLEKIIAEVYSPNAVMLHILGKLGFQQAGLLRRHGLLDGCRHDLWIGELFREDWKRLPRAGTVLSERRRR